MQLSAQALDHSVHDFALPSLGGSTGSQSEMVSQKGLKPPSLPGSVIDAVPSSYQYGGYSGNYKAIAQLADHDRIAEPEGGLSVSVSSASGGRSLMRRNNSFAVGAATPPSGMDADNKEFLSDKFGAGSSMSSLGSGSSSSAKPRKGMDRVGPVVSAAQLAAHKKNDEELSTMKPAVSSFYKNQNNVILGLLEMEELVKDSDEKSTQSERNEANLRAVKIAVNISFAVNVCLLGLKVTAAVQSGSLAVIASSLDSLLDLLSGSILFLISRQINKPDPYQYPVSKSRLEPVGIIVFASVMGMTSLYILQEAVQKLILGFTDSPSYIDLNGFSVGILIATITVKLVLHLYCRAVSTGSDSALVGALAQDHLNDVKTNSVALAAALVASYYQDYWWTDPVGAFLLSAFIIVNWIGSGKEQIGNLVGSAAPPAVIGQLAYLAAHHDARILRVDKVLAYHFGMRYIVEVDVVLPEDMPLKETHDIGESLEIKIEKLSIVERAFVHLDYECTHQPEHKVINRR